MYQWASEASVDGMARSIELAGIALSMAKNLNPTKEDELARLEKAKAETEARCEKAKEEIEATEDPEERARLALDWAERISGELTPVLERALALSEPEVWLPDLQSSLGLESAAELPESEATKAKDELVE